MRLDENHAAGCLSVTLSSRLDEESAHRLLAKIKRYGIVCIWVASVKPPSEAAHEKENGVLAGEFIDANRPPEGQG
jgi:hypothetical protein